MVTLVGALVFIGFAVASLFIDPYEENHLVPDVDVSNQFPRTYLEVDWCGFWCGCGWKQSISLDIFWNDYPPRVTTTTLQYSKRTKSSLSDLPRQSFHSSHCGWRTNIKKSASQRYEILARKPTNKAGPNTRVPAKIPFHLRNLAPLNVNLFVFSHKNDNSGNMNEVSQWTAMSK